MPTPCRPSRRAGDPTVPGTNRRVQSLLFRLSGAASTIPAASIGERQWRLPSLQSNTCVLVSHFDDFPYSNIPIPYCVSIRWQGER